ncbi:transcription factor GTE2-like [Phragmites australis]|uniref:transcription factor GTE2-like n=1 Tax=Phragmites australis TaxID=29695 RepID=UPI002D770D9D|nr:transcription factor GTE2-like [Phragmites australis]
MKMRKPKAREPNKREMSLEEKDMLRLGLESLPEEKMHNVLQIVRKRNSNPEMLGDEIELDIDEMDVETQWELDRFVTNCSKALKKSQRAAMTNGGIADITDAVVAEDSMVPVNGTVPTLVDNDDAESENPVKSTPMAEQVDEYIDIGDEMPTATYQSMEIEKDAEVASGSGGSGSGSSSTGSESGSSGDSASGAGNAHSLV